jgi:hypothetical protein
LAFDDQAIRRNQTGHDMTNLDYYLTYDHEARSKTTLLSIAAGIIAAGIATTFLASLKVQCVICVAVVGVVEISRARLYVQPSLKEQRVALNSRGLSRRSLVLLPVSAVVFLILAALPSIAEAEVNRRLRRLTAKVPLDAGSINDIKRTIDEAAAYRLNLRRSAERVISALQKTAEARPSLSGEAIGAGSTVASAITVNVSPPDEMRGRMVPSLPGATGKTWGFVAIATNTGPDNYATIGLARQPYCAVMEHADSPLPITSEFGPAFLVVKGLTADIDGFHLKNVIFQDMVLSYNGGTIALENVYFVNCQFRFKSNVRSWALVSTIAAANGWVTFSER